MLSREALDTFKSLYQMEFGEMLRDDEAEEMAIRLLRVFGLLSKPLTDETDRLVDS